MTDLNANFVTPERVRQYVEKGPPAFTPGHAGLMQMIGVLLAERMPPEGAILVIGAGGGPETRYLASIEPAWRFVGVDPAKAMLDLVQAMAGDAAGDRMTLVEGTVSDAPCGPFDAATCILVLGLVPDDGSKLDLLRQAHQRLSPGAPFILVDQCLDRSAPAIDPRQDSNSPKPPPTGGGDATIANARTGVGDLQSMVPAARNELLLAEAGFAGTELFYLGMAWRGWIAYAQSTPASIPA